MVFGLLLHHIYEVNWRTLQLNLWSLFFKLKIYAHDTAFNNTFDYQLIQGSSQTGNEIQALFIIILLNIFDILLSTKKSTI